MRSAPTAGSVGERLARVEALLADMPMTSLDRDGLAPVTESLRRIEARCAAIGVSIAQRAKAVGDDPGATLLGQGKVSGRRARQEARRAEVAEHLPELGSGLQRGTVSGEQLDAVDRARSGLSEGESERFDQLAPELAAAAERLPVDTFARQVRKLVDDARADHGLTRLQQQRARSELKMWTGADGMGHLHLTADPERFALVQTAIENETASLTATAKNEGDRVTKGPGLQVDALVELLGRAQGQAGRPNITLLVDQATLVDQPHDGTVCETANGVDLPVTVVERHLCDAVVQHVTLDDGGIPINVGRRYRTATPAQWSALNAMYATCVWDGCDRPITWTQAHHIHEWDHGGPTDLANLVPLCSRHHHMVHDGGWRLRLRADRTLEIHRPAGAARGRGQPPPPPTPGSLWATTRPDRCRAELTAACRAPGSLGAGPRSSPG